MDLGNLEIKSMLLCEACGSYHAEEDCEIVIVKVIKGKNCKLSMTKDNTVFSNNFSATNTSTNRNTVIEPLTTDTTKIQQDASVPAKKPVIKNIIPPGISSAMIPPGTPGFEEKGAKEFRRI